AWWSVAFQTGALDGMVRDKHGKKMSKSFGNAVDPLDWMDAYGSDALRFTLARGANPGVAGPIAGGGGGAAPTFATTSGTRPGPHGSTAPPRPSRCRRPTTCPRSTDGCCPGC